MQLVVFHPFLAHWLECSQPNVQRDFRGFNATFFDSSQNLGREVQTCGRGSRRALRASVDGLIALAVRRLILAGNVRRQRDVADAFEGTKEIGHRKEADTAFSEAAPEDYFRVQCVFFTEK